MRLWVYESAIQSPFDNQNGNTGSIKYMSHPCGFQHQKFDNL